MKIYLLSHQDLTELGSTCTSHNLNVFYWTFYRHCLRQTRNNVNWKTTTEEIKKVIVSNRRLLDL